MKRVHRSGRKYPRRSNWIRQRDACYERAGEKCEVTGEWLGYVVPDDRDAQYRQPLNPGDSPIGVWHWRRACHHIIAERWVRRFFKGVSPHIVENLVAVTPALHSKLTAAENKLFKADWLGYRTELHRLDFPLALLDQAFSALCAEEKKNWA